MHKFKKLSILGFLLLVFSITSLFSGTINYSAAEIKITIPNDWDYELDGSQLTIGLDEVELALSFNVIDDQVIELDEDYFNLLKKTAVTELENQTGGIVEMEEELFEDEIEGMAIFGSFSKLDTEDGLYGVFIAAFQRTPEKIVFLIVLGKEDDLETYGDDIGEILESIETIY